MNKIINYLIVIFLPLYPFWACLSITYLNIHVSKVVHLIFIPFAVFAFFKKDFNIPKYLLFFICFSIYNLYYVYYDDLKPTNTSWLFYIISDPNLIACTLFIVIENTKFEEWALNSLNKLIFLIIIISCIASIVQIQNNSFFVKPTVDDVLFVKEVRNPSIFSWIDLNSIGISFPILIAIILNFINARKIFFFSIIIISGISVSFLSKARYVMISTILAFLQMFFYKESFFLKRVYTVIIIGVCAWILISFADDLGVDLDAIISERIFEENAEFPSAQTRILSYEVFKISFPKNPWLGVGPKVQDDVLRMLQGVPVIHVGFLSYLYFYGIIGASFFFISLFFLLKDSWNVGKKHNYWGSFMAFVSFCFANLTLVYFNMSEMGIILAIVYLKYYKSKKETFLFESNYQKKQFKII